MAGRTVTVTMAGSGAQCTAPPCLCTTHAQHQAPSLFGQLGEILPCCCAVLLVTLGTPSATPSAALAAAAALTAPASSTPVAAATPTALAAPAAAASAAPASATALLLPRGVYVGLVHLLDHLVRHPQVLNRVATDVHLRQPEELVAVLWAQADAGANAVCDQNDRRSNKEPRQPAARSAAGKLGYAPVTCR